MTDSLRRRLEALIEKTKGAERLPAASWWVGDAAGERRVRDDMDAGRLFWKSAHDYALEGLRALEAGDDEFALACAWAATDYYVAALEKRIRPEEWRVLSRASQRRGRRKKTANNKSSNLK